MNHSFLNRLRNSAFWVIDTAKGGKIKTNLQDITESLSFTSFETLQKKNDKILDSLLRKAIEETSFYSDFHNYRSLQDFPVVDKISIRTNFDNMLTKSSKVDMLHTIFTSGSTGAPFMTYQNQGKKQRNTADTIYFAKQAGYTLGDKLLYLRLWYDSIKKKKISAFMQNIEQLSIEDLDDNLYIKALVEKLQKDKSPKGWLGYPSGMDKICNYLDSVNSKPLDCNIKSIIGMSENLSDDVRSRMSHYFGAPMVSRYSNFENGIIAQQAPNSDYFIINWASYIVEILSFDSNEPVKDGELGRIVITDLFNQAVPMIRYDTGDVGAMEFTDNQTYPVLKTVEGRKSDIILSTKGSMISPFKFMGLLPKFPEIKQIQFVQTEKSNYTIKVNIEDIFVREQELTTLFKSYVGQDAKIEVEYVNEIPLLSSKKRKLCRNLFTERNSSNNREKILHSL